MLSTFGSLNVPWARWIGAQAVPMPANVEIADKPGNRREYAGEDIGVPDDRHAMHRVRSDAQGEEHRRHRHVDRHHRERDGLGIAE